MRYGLSFVSLAYLATDYSKKTKPATCSLRAYIWGTLAATPLRPFFFWKAKTLIVARSPWLYRR